MKRFLLYLPVLLITSTAFAGGRPYDSGGCTAGQMSTFCSMIGFLIGGMVILVIVGGIWDAYKMRTDSAYRARAEQLSREYEERRRSY